MATRFQIVSSRWGHASYKIHLGEVVIPVRTPPLMRQLRGRESMIFTWPDLGECTITRPRPPSHAIGIISPGGSVWSGLPVEPRHRKELERPVIFLWHKEDHKIACDAGRVCCRAFPLMLTLREWEGRRLATWIDDRKPLRGSLREDLDEDMKPVILAMIMSIDYGFYSEGGA